MTTPLFAGIEAGGTKFVCAVGAGPDDLRAVTVFPTTTPGETLRRAIEFVREQQDQLGVRVAAIGIASFGPVDLRVGSPTYGHITSTPKPGWQDADVVGAFRTAFDVPIAFDTDTNGAVLAESRWGAGKGCDPLVYVTVGTGIGGGALIDGRLLHGVLHPEMGHLIVRREDDDSFEGCCPYHGDCLEGMASGPAIEARWGLSASELGPRREQAIAVEAWYLGQLVVAISFLLSPERIVLGGGVLKLPGLLPAVREETVRMLNGYLEVPPTMDIEHYLVPPGLGDHAGVLGGIALAEQSMTTT